MGERQQAHVNMIISASRDMRDGIYQTWISGKTGDSYVGRGVTPLIFLLFRQVILTGSFMAVAEAWVVKSPQI